MTSFAPAGYSDEESDSDNDLYFSSNAQRLKTNGPQLAKEPQKEHLFIDALENGDIDTIRNMLSNGFHVDQSLTGGWSGLMLACSVGKVPLVRFLLESNANVNYNKDMFTPLMALCKSSSTNEEDVGQCFDLLIQYGANIDSIDRYACSALMCACDAGHPSLVKKLLDNNCDVNIQDTEGWSALFHAVYNKQEEVIKILLEKKVRLDLIDRRRRSAYELALQKGYDEIAKLVCSEKEKRKLREEEICVDCYVRDPIEELFSQLPSQHSKSSSGFSADVNKILLSLSLGHYRKEFSLNKVQLNELLLITDERLKQIGVRFSVHRQRILNFVRNFHLQQWKKSSLGLKPLNQKLDVKDGVKLMCNVTKHLHILNATIEYVRTHQPVPIISEVFNKREDVVHQVDLIKSELLKIHLFARCLKEKENIEPVDLIQPSPVKNQSKHYLVPTLITTGIVFFFCWKRISGQL